MAAWSYFVKWLYTFDPFAIKIWAGNICKLSGNFFFQFSKYWCSVWKMSPLQILYYYFHPFLFLFHLQIIHSIPLLFHTFCLSLKTASTNLLKNSERSKFILIIMWLKLICWFHFIWSFEYSCSEITYEIFKKWILYYIENYYQNNTRFPVIFSINNNTCIMRFHLSYLNVWNYKYTLLYVYTYTRIPVSI